MQLTDLEVEELRKSFLSHCNLMGADAEAIAPLLDYCSNLTKSQPGPFVILLDKIAQVWLSLASTVATVAAALLLTPSARFLAAV